MFQTTNQCSFNYEGSIDSSHLANHPGIPPPCHPLPQHPQTPSVRPTAQRDSVAVARGIPVIRHLDTSSSSWVDTWARLHMGHISKKNITGHVDSKWGRALDFRGIPHVDPCCSIHIFTQRYLLVVQWGHPCIHQKKLEKGSSILHVFPTLFLIVQPCLQYVCS